MSRVIIVFAFVMTSISILLSGPVLVPDVPSSIHQAFLDEHPSATHHAYRFSTDDAGSFFQIEFEESGTRQVAEYRYTNHDWLLDERDTLAVDREEASFGADERGNPLALTRF